MPIVIGGTSSARMSQSFTNTIPADIRDGDLKSICRMIKKVMRYGEIVFTTYAPFM